MLFSVQLFFFSPSPTPLTEKIFQSLVSSASLINFLHLLQVVVVCVAVVSYFLCSFSPFFAYLLLDLPHCCRLCCYAPAAEYQLKTKTSEEKRILQPTRICVGSCVEYVVSNDPVSLFFAPLKKHVTRISILF